MKVRTGDRATLKWIVSTVKGKKRYVAALTAVQMVSSFSSMGYAVFLGALVDCAAAGNKAGFFRYCGLLVGLVVFLFVLVTFCSHIWYYWFVCNNICSVSNCSIIN